MRSSLIRRLLVALTVFAFLMAPGSQSLANAAPMVGPSSHCIHADKTRPDKMPTDRGAKLLCCAAVCTTTSVVIPLQASLVMPSTRHVLVTWPAQESLTSVNIAPDPFPPKLPSIV